MKEFGIIVGGEIWPAFGCLLDLIRRRCSCFELNGRSLSFVVLKDIVVWVMHNFVETRNIPAKPISTNEMYPAM